MACPECKSERCGTMNETHSEADAWHQEALCQGRQATGAIAARDAYREALRALVEALPRCNYVGCDRLAGWRMPYGPMCDEHKPPDADIIAVLRPVGEKGRDR